MESKTQQQLVSFDDECPTKIEALAEDCVSKILSYTSPADACRFSMLSSSLRSAADSDLLWRSFLPSDHTHILSRALSPLTLNSSSFKHLFHALSHPLLLDAGNISFKLDKSSAQKSYILSARELSITWSNDPLYWCWRPAPESRFKEVVELRTVSWLEIQGKIETKILTQNTSYGAYLIMKISHREYGLDSVVCDVSVQLGNKVQSGRVYLCKKLDEKKDEGIGIPRRREDGWMEVEVGEFLSGEGEEVVKISLMEVGYRLKGGLIVEGLEELIYV
ncbi:F-box protein PP2-B15 isoform X2 [Cajanus cajan]|uniref:F-box protein PP2-B15 isoform X2 n=1 Tax=Cajanus cajan TaxID=3821 RepID=UPI0010FB9C43|nr:F-box protein PP2-B15 isoform X2 [Cajanus cajan]